jgi:hypothetical protein
MGLGGDLHAFASGCLLLALPSGVHHSTAIAIILGEKCGQRQEMMQISRYEKAKRFCHQMARRFDVHTAGTMLEIVANRSAPGTAEHLRQQPAQYQTRTTNRISIWDSRKNETLPDEQHRKDCWAL